MKLLLVTQAIDTEDPVLGFFTRWVEELAKRVERVEVICLKEGKHELPENVSVHSLGKENSLQKTVYRKIQYAARFLWLAWKLRRDYDAVFVHMNPEYLDIAGVLWLLLKKPTVLWYVHRAVNLRLRLAHSLANAVATSAPESYGIRSAKVHYIGHGIDVDRFTPTFTDFRTPIRITSVGRITHIKNLDTLIEAIAILRQDGFSAHATLLGAPVTRADEAYREALIQLARERGVADAVYFPGSIPHDELPAHLGDFDIAVNLSPDGGMDKAVLEAMAAGLLVFASNHAFVQVFDKDARELMFRERDARDCALKVERFLCDRAAVRPVRERLVHTAREMSVESVVSKILSLYEAGR